MLFKKVDLFFLYKLIKTICDIKVIFKTNYSELE